MRFFEYEAREIVKRAGIPVTDYGFATTPQEAREIAEQDRRAGRHQVPGPHRRADEGRRRAVRRHAGRGGRDRPSTSSTLEINGHMPRGVLVDPKASVAKEYYAGVVWDGIRKQPVMLFSDMGGIDIEEVAESHPDHVGRGHFSNILPLSDYQAKEVIASRRGHRPPAQPAVADPHRARAAVRRARHDAGRDQPARRARGRLVRRARRAHGHGERGPPAPEGPARGARRRRRGDAPGARGRPRSSSPARRSTPWTTAAWPATSPSSTATSAS